MVPPFKPTSNDMFKFFNAEGDKGLADTYIPWGSRQEVKRKKDEFADF